MAIAERLFAPLALLRKRITPKTLAMAHDGVLQVVQAPLVPARAPSAVHAPLTPSNLIIPCPDPTKEERERDRHQLRGQKLARLEDWEELTAEIARVDARGDRTSGGMPVAELLAYGARADVVSAGEHALLTGSPPRDAPLMAGIEALERLLAEDPGNSILGGIVAMAHVDLGWAWRGTGWDIEVPMRNREAFAAHFDRAADIMAEFRTDTMESPLLAATMCALSAGRTSPIRRITRLFEAWIDIDPRNPRAYRSYGAQMLPRWHGSYDQLELAARSTAGRTHDVWGAGAYAWVMFDAIASDPEACARLDLDFFLDGLHDILHHRGDQYTVNLLAAYCANTMGATQTGNDETDYVRNQIAAAAGWIVRDHLTELHPMLWAHAARGFDNALRIRSPSRFAASGQADALYFLNTLFRRELNAGMQVVFTENGAETRAA